MLPEKASFVQWMLFYHKKKIKTYPVDRLSKSSRRRLLVVSGMSILQ